MAKVRKINKHQKAIEDYIRSIPLDEIEEIEVYKIQEILYKHQQQWRSSDEYQKKCQLLREKNEQKRAAAAERSKFLKEWAKKNIKTGMLIKVKGARDGKGLREVLSFTENRIVCRQWSIHGFNVNDNKLQWDEKIWAVPCNQITEHEWNKVLGVFGMSSSMKFTGYKTVAQLSEE